MNMMKRAFALLITIVWFAAPLAAMQPPGGAARDGFVPIDQLPPQEQLPAAPLLITAYAFVWLLLMFYLWSIAKRLGRVQSELDTLRRRAPGGTPR